MKKALLLVLAAAALSTGGPAAGQTPCVGYLIPKDASLWKEGAGDDLRSGERAEYLPAIPRRAWNPGLGVKLLKGPRLNWLGGCRLEDAEHDQKTKRVLLVLLDGRTEDFEEAWAMPSDLVAFKYDHPGNDQDGPDNLATILKAADVARGDVGIKDFKAPKIENQRVFKASFGATWSALVETMSARSWQVEKIEKESGLVTTKPSSDKSDAAMACATKHDGRSNVSLSVFAKAVGPGVRVTVNATFHATRAHKDIACYSNGTLEKELFDGIAKSLAASVRGK